MSFETPGNMYKCCSTCRWNEPFNGVCYNADSPHCADFWDDGCDEWEGVRLWTQLNFSIR